MKAEDLRLGLFVKCLMNDYEKKIGINDIAIADKYQNLKKTSIPYEPIPLTKEWLYKFGLSQGNKCYDNAYSINILETDFYLRPSFEGSFYWGFNISDEKTDCELNDVRPLNYVHELQNLYFAITGEELNSL